MMQLSRRIRGAMGALALLMAAGCFQPAGEAIEPTAAQIEALPTDAAPTRPPAADTDAAPTLPPTETDAPPALNEFEASATALATPITPDADPTTLPAQRAPDTDPTGTPSVEVLNIETIVAETLRASGGTLSPTPRSLDAAAPTQDPQMPPIITATAIYITPLAPQGPISLPTATPTPIITPTLISGGSDGDGAEGSVSPFIESADGCFYIVQPGDSLFAIAIDNGLALDDLRAANPDINPQALQIGQQLHLPACVDTPTPAPTLPPTASLPPGSAPTATRTPEGVVYIVRPGDTVTAIATRYGVTVAEIVRANAALQANPNLLSVGQELIIPIEPTAAPTLPPSATPTPRDTVPPPIEPVIAPSSTAFEG